MSAARIHRIAGSVFPPGRNAVPPAAPPAALPEGAKRLGPAPAPRPRDYDSFLRQLPPAEIVAVNYDMIGAEDVPNALAGTEITFAGDEGKREPGSLNDSRLGAVGQLPCGLCGQTANACPQHFGFINLANSPVVNPHVIAPLIMVLNAVCPECGGLLVPESTLARRGILSLHGRARLAAINEIARGPVVDSCPHCTAAPGVPTPITLTYDTKRSQEAHRLYQIPKAKQDGPRPTSPLDENDILVILRKIRPETLAVLGFGTTSPQSFVMRYVLVLPPAMRPPTVLQNGDTVRPHDLTEAYKKIIAASTRAAKKAELVDAVYQLFVKSGRGSAAGKRVYTLTSMLNGKQGVPRRRAQTGRVSNNARSVISPETGGPADYVRVPRLLAKVLTVPQVVTDFNRSEIEALHAFGEVKGLIYGPNRGDTLRGNRYKVSAGNYDALDFQVGDVAERSLQDGDAAIITRQPVIHKQGMLGVRVKLGEPLTLGINMALTSPLNADFDGDEATLHRPQGQSDIETTEVMGVNQNLIDEQTGRNMMGVVYDPLSGAFLLTAEDTDVPAPLFFDCLVLVSPDYDVQEFLGRAAALGLGVSEFDRAAAAAAALDRLAPAILGARFAFEGNSAGGARPALLWEGRVLHDLGDATKELAGEFPGFPRVGPGRQAALEARVRQLARDGVRRRLVPLLGACADFRRPRIGAEALAARDAGEQAARFRQALGEVEQGVMGRLAQGPGGLAPEEAELARDVFWGLASPEDAAASLGSEARAAALREAVAAFAGPMAAVVALNDVPAAPRPAAELARIDLRPLGLLWAAQLGRIKDAAAALQALRGPRSFVTPEERERLAAEHGPLLAEAALAAAEAQAARGDRFYPGRLLASAAFPPNLQYPSALQEGGDLRIENGIIVRGQLNGDSIGRAANSIIHRVAISHGEAAANRILTFLPIVVNKWLETRGFTIGIADCFLEPQVAAEIQQSIRAERVAADGKIEELRRFEGTAAGRRKVEEIVSTMTSNIKTVGMRVARQLPPENPIKVMLGAKSKATPEAMIKMVSGGGLGQIFVHGRRPIAKTLSQRHVPWSAPGASGLRDYGFVTGNYASGLEPLDIFPEQEAGRASNVTIAVEASKVGTIDRQLAVSMQGIIVYADGSVRTERGVVIQPVYAEDGFARAAVVPVRTPTAVDRRTAIPSFVDVSEIAAMVNAAARREAAGGVNQLPPLFAEQALASPETAASLAEALASPRLATLPPPAARSAVPAPLPAFRSPPAPAGTTRRDVLYRDFLIARRVLARIADHAKESVGNAVHRPVVEKEAKDALEHAMINAMNHPAMQRVRADERTWMADGRRPLEEATLVWQVMHNGAWLDEGPKAAQIMAGLSLRLRGEPVFPSSINYAAIRFEQTVQRGLLEPIEPSSEEDVRLEDRSGDAVPLPGGSYAKAGLRVGPGRPDYFLVFREFRAKITPRIDFLLRRARRLDDVLCVLLAYEALFPGGQQFTYLLFDRYAELGAGGRGIAEGFASPLNAIALARDEGRPGAERMEFRNFCSLFPTIDAPFGSVGDFFTVDFAQLPNKPRALTVNPPYTEKVLAAAALRTAELVRGGAIEQATFVGPTWEDAEFHRILTSLQPELRVGTERMTWEQARAFSFSDELLLPTRNQIFFYTISRPQHRS